MPIGLSGPISINGIYNEMFGSNLTSGANMSLEQLVSMSYLTNKSRPYSIGSFYGYTHRSTPVINSFTPNSNVTTGTVVTVSGDNFGHVVSLSISNGGSIWYPSYTVVSKTQLTFTMPNTGKPSGTSFTLGMMNAWDEGTGGPYPVVGGDGVSKPVVTISLINATTYDYDVYAEFMITLNQAFTSTTSVFIEELYNSSGHVYTGSASFNAGQTSKYYYGSYIRETGNSYFASASIKSNANYTLGSPNSQSVHVPATTSSSSGFMAV
jgi:hypothetical protein